VLDYGAYPDQKRPYFTLRDARPTLTGIMPSGGVEAAIYAGLETLTGQILGRAWRRDDGADLRVERCLIDANWGSSTDVVYQFLLMSQMVRAHFFSAAECVAFSYSAFAVLMYSANEGNPSFARRSSTLPSSAMGRGLKSAPSCVPYF
jgi:hypothetical protein